MSRKRHQKKVGISPWTQSPNSNAHITEPGTISDTLWLKVTFNRKGHKKNSGRGEPLAGLVDVEDRAASLATKCTFHGEPAHPLPVPTRQGLHLGVTCRREIPTSVPEGGWQAPSPCPGPCGAATQHIGTSPPPQEDRDHAPVPHGGRIRWSATAAAETRGRRLQCARPSHWRPPARAARVPVKAAGSAGAGRRVGRGMGAVGSKCMARACHPFAPFLAPSTCAKLPAVCVSEARRGRRMRHPRNPGSAGLYPAGLHYLGPRQPFRAARRSELHSTHACPGMHVQQCSAVQLTHASPTHCGHRYVPPPPINITQVILF